MFVVVVFNLINIRVTYSYNKQITYTEIKPNYGNQFKYLSSIPSSPAPDPNPGKSKEMLIRSGVGGT